MIHRLRSQHRSTFVLLAMVLIVGLVLALGGRKAAPTDPRAQGEPSILEPAAPELRAGVMRTEAIELRWRLWEAGATVGRILELTPARDLQRPDLLVYWSDSGASDELPLQSLLLGSLAGVQTRRFVLPAGKSESKRGGRLYLYSLAHQELIATLEVAP